MQLLIRPFTEADYWIQQKISCITPSEKADSIGEIRYNDSHRDPRCLFQRWVVELDGEGIAIGEYSQDAQRYHPQVFTIHGLVHPGYRRQGIGGTLYTYVINALRSFHPRYIRKRIQADNEAGLSFLKVRGFQEERQIQESCLDLAHIHFPSHTSNGKLFLARHIEFSSLKDLASDRERDRKLYELIHELSHDVPSPQPSVSVSYEEFVTYRLHHHTLMPELSFIAHHHDEYIGVSELKATARKHELTTGLTAVKRPYRQQGIGRALKLRCISSANRAGYAMIRTTNDTRNTAILGLNEQLGFVKKDIWIELTKEMRLGETDCA
jgi:GNAT superfamily N-acetyltransferase